MIHQPVDGLGSTVEEHAVGGGERGAGHVVAFEGEFEGDRCRASANARASGPSPTLKVIMWGTTTRWWTSVRPMAMVSASTRSIMLFICPGRRLACGLKREVPQDGQLIAVQRTSIQWVTWDSLHVDRGWIRPMLPANPK